MMLYRTRRIQQALCGLFLADPQHTWHAVDMWRAAGVNSGGLYIVLARMQRDGWLTTGWDVTVRPTRRRWYRPTAEGEAGMRAWLLGQNWIGKSKSSEQEGGEA